MTLEGQCPLLQKFLQCFQWIEKKNFKLALCQMEMRSIFKD